MNVTHCLALCWINAITLYQIALKKRHLKIGFLEPLSRNFIHFAKSQCFSTCYLIFNNKKRIAMVTCYMKIIIFFINVQSTVYVVSHLNLACKPILSNIYDSALCVPRRISALIMSSYDNVRDVACGDLRVCVRTVF